MKQSISKLQRAGGKGAMRGINKQHATYLLSPFDGNPIASRGSKLTGFNRLHGAEFARPPRLDIWKLCGVVQQLC